MEPNEKNTEENLDETKSHPLEHEKHIDDLKNQNIEGEEILGGAWSIIPDWAWEKFNGSGSGEDKGASGASGSGGSSGSGG